MRRSWAAPAGTVAERFPAMGCEVLVILPSERAAHADTVSALFAEWEARLSRFRPDSDLSRLNAAAGRPTWVREPLLGVLRRALRAARATRGVFDPTLAPELSVIGYATTFSEVRGEVAAVPAPARASSWHEVRIGPGGLVSLPADLTVDLGGIAKGMAVDAALAALRAEGVPFALVSAGGDLGVLGGRSWPVAVEAADGETVVSLTAGALATSSTEERRWRTASGEMHHLIDPRTRRPATTDLVRVTVHAPTCETAEVAAKAALILGSDDGAAFLERHRLTALLSTADAPADRRRRRLPELRHTASGAHRTAERDARPGVARRSTGGARQHAPKVEAAARFADAGGTTMIGSLNQVGGLLAGKAGTVIGRPLAYPQRTPISYEPAENSAQGSGSTRMARDAASSRMGR